MGYFSILSTPDPGASQEEEAIQTLSNRLQHATLTADRKLAVLGLKSFSRQFRETVIQHGLRALLQTLARDTENAAIVKTVLETLLSLFLRGASDDLALGWISNQSRIQNGKYPSPLLVEHVELDEFLNWIADEMILSDVHVQALTDVLTQHLGFQIRLYALQILEAIVAARPVRAKECLINIPLAVSTIVSVLGDPNDPIRNECILLLMALVNNNFNIQKLVAFENTFERIFDIIEEEGGIRGSILVQDCMTLLTNMLTYNASNQKFFLETDCVPKLARLIAEPIEDSLQNLADENGNPIPSPPLVWTEQRLQNMNIALGICRSFVDPENQLLAANQAKLHSSGIFYSILRLVFSPAMENHVRHIALQVTGDIISNNAALQLEFSHIDVPYVDPSLPLQVQNYSNAIPAPLALLNWALLVNSVHTFEIRLAAMYCLNCFFAGNDDAKMAFLHDQIKASKNPLYYEELQKESTDDHEEDGKEAPPKIPVDPQAKSTPYANIITTLTIYDLDIKINPYKAWFSAMTLVNLIYDSPSVRDLARLVRIGDKELGEEEMSLISAISNMLVANLENTDPRIAVGYVVLLTLWFYEDFDAVNDFLEDQTVLKSLLGFLSKQSSDASEIVLGSCALLVGTCYEFSTSTSPCTRSSVYELITKAIGRDNYLLKIKQFREIPSIKHFDSEASLYEKDATGLPMLFFIREYVDLVRDNFYRFKTSLARGPEFEPRTRISFEIFEELENKNAELRKSILEIKQNAEEHETELNQKIEESRTEFVQTNEMLEKCKEELEQYKVAGKDHSEKIEALANKLTQLEADKEKFEKSSEYCNSEYLKLSKKSSSSEELLNKTKAKLADAEAAKKKAEDGINKMSRELFQLSKQKDEADNKSKALSKEVDALKLQLAKTQQELELAKSGAQKIVDDLKAKIGILEKDNDNQQHHEPSVHKSSSTLREFQKKVSDLEEENDDLIEKLRSAATVVAELRKENAQLTSYQSELETDLKKAYEDLESFAKLLDDMNSSQAKGVEQTATSVASVTSDNSDIEAKLQQASTELTEIKTQFATERDAFETELARLKSLVSEISSQENSDAVEKLTANLQELREELNQKEKTNSELQKSMTTEKATLEKELLELRTHNVKLEDELSELRGNNLTEAAANTETHEAFESQAKELAICKKRIEDFERNIEILSESARTSLSSFQQSQTTLKTRIAELEQSKAELQSELEKSREEEKLLKLEHQDAIEDLESVNMDLELQMKNLRKNREDADQKLAQVEKDSTAHIAKLNEQVQKLLSALEKCEAEKKHLEDEYYELENLSNIIGSELKAKETLLQALNNKGGDLAVKDKIVIEIKERLATTIAELGDSEQKLRLASKSEAELKDKLSHAIEELEQAKSESQKLESAANEAKKELEQVKLELKRLSPLKEKLHNMGEVNDDQNNVIENLKTRNQELEEALLKANTSLDEHKKESLEQSELSTSSLTEQIRKLEYSLIESHRVHETEIADVRRVSDERVEQLEAEIAVLSKRDKDLEITKSETDENLEKARIASDEKIEVLQKQLETMQVELEEKDFSIRTLQESLSEKSSELNSFAEREEEEHETLKERESVLGDLRKQLEVKDQQLANFETQSQEAKSKSLEIVDELELMKARLEEAREELQNDKTKIEALEAKISDLSRLQDTHRDVESEKESIMSKLQDLDEELSKLQKNTQEKDAEINDLKNRLKLSQQESEERHAKNEQLTEELLEQKQKSEDLSKHGDLTDDMKEGDNKAAGQIESQLSEAENSIELLRAELSALEAEKKASNDLVESAEESIALLKLQSEEWQAEKESITKAREEHETTVSSLEKELESQQSLHEILRKTMEESKSAFERRLAELESELGAKEEELKQVREASKEAREPTLSELNSEEVAHEKAARQRAEQDLADLMLIFEDTEKLVKKYKMKLRAFDVPLSEDDDDEDMMANGPEENESETVNGYGSTHQHYDNPDFDYEEDFR